MNYKKQKEQSNQYREELTHRCNLIIQFYMEHYTPGDPISKIIPNYWNNTQNRAIKDVLFTRIKKLRIKTPGSRLSPYKYSWILNVGPRVNMDVVVTQVMQRIDELRYIISKKNRRTVPQSLFANPSLTFKFHSESNLGGFELISWPAFRARYTRELEDEELVRSIYTAIEEAYAAGVRVGQNTSAENKSDMNSLIDIHDNIEQAVANLKKLIDKE